MVKTGLAYEYYTNMIFNATVWYPWKEWFDCYYWSSVWSIECPDQMHESDVVWAPREKVHVRCTQIVDLYRCISVCDASEEFMYRFQHMFHDTVCESVPKSLTKIFITYTFYLMWLLPYTIICMESDVFVLFSMPIRYWTYTELVRIGTGWDIGAGTRAGRFSSLCCWDGFGCA